MTLVGCNIRTFKRFSIVNRGNPIKELSFCHKLEFSNLYIFATGWRKPLIFQTYMIWSNRNHSLKYVRSMSLGCKDIGIRKSKVVAKTQFLYSGYGWAILAGPQGGGRCGCIGLLRNPASLQVRCVFYLH